MIYAHSVGGVVEGIAGQIRDIETSGCQLHEQMRNKSKTHSPRVDGLTWPRNSFGSENPQMCRSYE